MESDPAARFQCALEASDRLRNIMFSVGRESRLVASPRGNQKSLVQERYTTDIHDRLVWTPLHVAAATGNVEIVKLLLKGEVGQESSDDNHVAPIIEATQGNHVDIVQLLIECGVDIEEKNLDGDTALHIASQKRLF